MKAIFTGMNGTVAPPVATYFQEKGFEIIAYNRDKVSITNKEEIEKFVLECKADLFLHFAMGSYDWTSMLAMICKNLGIPFVYISTVSVFSNDQRGPYRIDSIPDANDDYGLYKRESERHVLTYNPDAYIIRLGWQIGLGKGKNQMIDYLYKQMDDQGFISASSLWYPSVSFLTDSAQAIYQIIHDLPSGLYQVNSNESYTFYEIVTYLRQYHLEFIVRENKDFDADHRMIDDRVKIRKLSEIFKRK
jgi:dTDP-4-dehydrorhamnose reductase